MVSLPRPSLRPLVGTALCAVALVACGGDSGGDHEIDVVRTVEKQRPENTMPRTSAQRFRSEQPGGSARGGGSRPMAGLAWDLPEGWSEKAPSSMRQGNFGIDGHPDVECFLTVLQGTGGGLAGNLNRWRKQMGLPDLPAAEIDALPRYALLGQPAHYLEMRGSYFGMGGNARPDYLMAGVARELPAAALFLKIVGPESQVEPQLGNFRALVESIRMGGGGSKPAGQAPRDATHGAAAPVKWTVPQGWVEGSAKSMRIVTLHPAGHPEAECYVTILAGDGGGVAANLNRWRKQMNQPPLDAAGLEALPKIELLGSSAPLLDVTGDYVGMGDQDQKQSTMLATMAGIGQGMLFVKMTGPADVVAGEKQRFVQFCESME